MGRLNRLIKYVNDGQTAGNTVYKQYISETLVPRHRLGTFGHRAFSVTGPTVWNSLPDSLRDPALSSDRFRQLLKTNLFRRYH